MGKSTKDEPHELAGGVGTREHRNSGLSAQYSADTLRNAHLQAMAVQRERLVRFTQIRTDLDAIEASWRRGDINGAESIRQASPLMIEMLELAYGPWPEENFSYPPNGSLQ